MTLSLGWDVVPVVVQDPCWEQSFPEVSGFVLLLTGAARGGPNAVRISRREAGEHRETNQRRLAGLIETFTALELNPVLVSSEKPVEILATFMRWHVRRRERLLLR